MDTFSEIEGLEAEIKSVQDEIDRRKAHPEEARDPAAGQEALAALELRKQQLNARLTELVERSADSAGV
jgi:predicted  nucleic acid-binding Zn-ribbon protein